MHLYSPHILLLIMQNVIHCIHARFTLALLGNCFEKFNMPYLVSSIEHKTIDGDIMS